MLAWTEANFCGVFICRNLSIARSRRRNRRSSSAQMGGNLPGQNPSSRWRDRIGIKRLLQRHLVWLPLATPRCSVLPPGNLKPEPSTDVPHGCLPGLTREMTNDGEKGHQRSTSKNAHKPEHHHDNHDGHYGSHDTTHEKIPSVGTGSAGRSDNNRA